MKQLRGYESTVAILITLLQRLQVKVTNSAVNETLQQHPSKQRGSREDCRRSKLFAF